MTLAVEYGPPDKPEGMWSRFFFWFGPGRS